MRKGYTLLELLATIAVLIIVVVIGSVIFGGLFNGCGGNSYAKKGGSKTIKLNPGQKLQTIEWKGKSSLWLLTRDMREGELPETWHYQEKSQYGVVEGSVTIVEQARKEKR